MNILIAPFCPCHIPAAAALEKVCFSRPWSETAFRCELDNPHAVLRCALDPSDRLLGWAGFQFVCDEGSVTNIAVSPDARHCGIGESLTRSLLSLAREHHLSFLTLEVRVSNAPAISLYRKLGFSPLGVRPRFYDRPLEDALMMRAQILLP